MATHHFEPDHYHNAIGTYDPVLHIGDGDTVVTTTVDASGHDRDNRRHRRDRVSGPDRHRSGTHRFPGSQPRLLSQG